MFWCGSCVTEEEKIVTEEEKSNKDEILAKITMDIYNLSIASHTADECIADVYKINFNE